ncbi:MAG: diacylglycerol kinase family lipid kinase [Candidatus Kapabacteria bacterium]|nr:diacylglycerol kinase family lipid kinase [Candidatus Kapabacteria bacterium]
MGVAQWAYPPPVAVQAAAEQRADGRACVTTSACDPCDPTDRQILHARCCSGDDIHRDKATQAPCFRSFPAVSEHIIALHKRSTCPVLAHASSLLGCKPILTEHIRHAEQLAASLPSDASLLVVSGGDGTVSEVVNGLMQRPSEQRPSVLIIPGGSGNDVARMLGLRRNAADVARRLRERRTVQWDVLRAELTSPLNVPDVRYCINVMSAGITADVSQVFNRSMRWLPPDLGYIAAALVSFSRFSPRLARLSHDGAEARQRLLLAVFANSRWFGSGMGVAPHAAPDDGMIDLTVAGSVSPLQFVGMIPTLRKAREVSNPEIQYLRAAAGSLDAETPLPIEIDGEFSGFTPLKVTVIPRAITFVS